MIQRKKLFATFVRFGMVGVLATALHYGLFITSCILLWGPMRPFTVGYLLGFVANFYLTSYFTFGTSPSWRKLFGMGGAHAVNYLLQIGLLNFFLWTGVDEVWAPLPVYAITVPVNFILVRFVFTSKNE